MPRFVLICSELLRFSSDLFQNKTEQIRETPFCLPLDLANPREENSGKIAGKDSGNVFQSRAMLYIQGFRAPGKANLP